MKKHILYVLAILCLPVACRQAVESLENDRIAAVPFTQIHLTDNFWTSRIEINRTVSIPSAFYQC